MPPSVQVELLNAPRLRFAQDRPHVLERKDAALLAVLAIDGPTPRARIAAMLWPDSGANAARNSLRQRLFRLRRAAGADIVVAEASLRLADTAEPDVAQLAQRLDADADALRGELLGDHAYDDCEELQDWVRAARERWRIARRDAIAERAGRLEAEGRLASALLYAARLVADAPLSEHAHRRLMRLHYLRGDRAAALTAFERCRELLHRELRTLPGGETRELAAVIERSGSLAATAPSAPRSIAMLRPPQLVGRHAEWQRLERAYAEGSALLVSGEAGIGKSRLLGEFAAAHGAAAPINARPGDARVPYALMARLLRGLVPRFGLPGAPWIRRELARLAPELGTAAAERLDALRLRQALFEALAHWRAAGLALLVLDDLHFADEATLELLPALATEARLCALLGAGEGDLPPTLRRWLATAAAARVEHLPLAPLDVTAIASLLASMAIPGLDESRWAEPLARHTGGNPLFIVETLLALAPGSLDAMAEPAGRLPMPARVDELIGRRLGQLSPRALNLARVAAIAGQDFSAELAAQVLKLDALDLSESWRELEQAHVFRGDAFAHDLFREAAIASLPQPIAQLLHGDVAAVLQRSGAAPARIAQHHLQAGQWAGAGEQFRAAARDAAAIGRKDEECSLLELAGDCFVRARDSTNAVLAFADLANSHLTFSRFQLAWAAVQRARENARSEQERLWCLDAAADVHNNERNHEQALACANEALALARRLGDVRAQFNAARKAAGALATLGRYDEALALHDAQRQWSAGNEEDADVRVYLCDRGYLLEQAGRSLDAIDAYRRASEVARRRDDRPVENFALANMAVTFWRLGQYGDALRAADEAAALRRQMGGGGDDGAVDLAQRAAILRDAGRFDEALQSLLEILPALRAPGATSFWTTAAEDHLALLYLLLGQPGRMATLLKAPADGSAAAQAHRLIVRARAERFGGGCGGAFARQAGELVREAGPVRVFLLAQLEYACAVAPDEGAVLCTELAERARLRQSPGLQVHALLRAAQLFLTAGEVEEALARLRAAQSLGAQHLPFGLYTPERDWIAYQVLAVAGDTAAARTALDAGRCWIEAAAQRVPANFRDSYARRNPVNRRLLEAAARQPIGNGPDGPAIRVTAR